jgi:alkylation response protein AidB-like acyl-CoA dehydrogenase
MDYFSPERNPFLLKVKKFADTSIRPFARQFEENECTPVALIEEMGRMKLLGATFPARYGGLEMQPLEYGYLTEILGMADPSIRSLLTVHTSLVGSVLMRFGTEKQKEQWLPLMAEGKKLAAFALTEPEVGTDAAGIQTKYERYGDKALLNGKKKWITYSGLADLFLVIARDDDKVNGFIVERNLPGITLKPMKGLLAGKASHLSEIEFCDVDVPWENRVGPDGGGFTHVVSTALDHGRFSVAWGGLGIASAALEAMVDYSRSRKQFGKKIYNFQMIQQMIANAVTKIHSARALCEKAAFYRANYHADAVTETVMAKYFTSKIAMEIAIDAVQVHGGNGFSSEFPVERLFREAKVLEVIEGTSQVLQHIISIYGLKKYSTNASVVSQPEKADAMI